MWGVCGQLPEIPSQFAGDGLLEGRNYAGSSIRWMAQNLAVPP
jgi:hypothetical protein